MCDPAYLSRRFSQIPEPIVPTEEMYLVGFIKHLMKIYESNDINRIDKCMDFPSYKGSDDFEHKNGGALVSIFETIEEAEKKLQHLRNEKIRHEYSPLRRTHCYRDLLRMEQTAEPVQGLRRTSMEEVD
jgi:hypothetical protein